MIFINIHNSIIELENIIEDLRHKWIKSLRNGSTGIGYTFECLINKDEDNLSLPDYKGIEIKVKRYFSKGYITLFCCAMDGCSFEYVFNNYAYLVNNKKRFMVSTKGSDLFFLSRKYKAFIYNDKIRRKIILVVCDLYGNPIDFNISWSYKLLKKRLYDKFKYLAIIRCSCKNNNGVEYFNYNRINFYKLKSFRTFIKMIEYGNVRISFKSYQDDDLKVQNHGTSFDINIKDIDLLFDEIKR